MLNSNVGCGAAAPFSLLAASFQVTGNAADFELE